MRQTRQSVETYSQETYIIIFVKKLNIKSRGFAEVVAQRGSVKTFS